MALETVVMKNSSFIFTNRKYCGLSPSKQQIQGAFHCGSLEPIAISSRSSLIFNGEVAVTHSIT